jgi:MoaA/NifB/PqqE/SkfB family radical SAM enzyme
MSTVIPLRQVGDPAPFARPKHIFMLHFDIVRGCQLQCVGCPTPEIESKIHRISVDDWAQSLANIDVEKVNMLRLYRSGEPLLHKQLPQIVEQIPRQRWKASVVEISTNGQWVDWAGFEDAMKLEVVNKLVVSCDGNGTPEDYERLRPPSKWSKLEEFLERVRVIRDRWAPAMTLHTRTIVRTRADAERWNNFLQPRGWLPEFRKWMALPEAKENLTGRAIMVPRGHCVYMADAKEFVHNPWHGEMNLLYVDADSSVVTCPVHPHAHVLGNLKEQRYSDILHGEHRKKLLAAMEKSRSTLSVCGVCEVGPPGNEGPSYWSAFAYWNPEKLVLPEGEPTPA